MKTFTVTFYEGKPIQVQADYIDANQAIVTFMKGKIEYRRASDNNAETIAVVPVARIQSIVCNENKVDG